MYDMKMHYTYCVVLIWKGYITLERTIWIFERMHCIRTHSADFWENTILGRIIWFLIEYYTRTYSMIFDFIMHSVVQYDFWENTILEYIVWFFIYTTPGCTVRFLREYYTRTYSMILSLYCTPTYNTIFD